MFNRTPNTTTIWDQFVAVQLCAGVLVVFVGLSLGSNAFAVLPAEELPPELGPEMGMVSNPNQSQMDFSKIQPIESGRVIHSKDVSNYIPTNMTPTNNGGTVATRILSKSVDTFFRSPEVRNSDIGHTTQSVEKAMNQNTSWDDESGVQHKVSFQLQAAQTQALVDYQGFTNAQLTYKVLQQEFCFETYRALNPATKLVYDHTIHPGDSRDILSLRWNF